MDIQDSLKPLRNLRLACAPYEERKDFNALHNDATVNRQLLTFPAISQYMATELRYPCEKLAADNWEFELHAADKKFLIDKLKYGLSLLDLPPLNPTDMGYSLVSTWERGLLGGGLLPSAALLPWLPPSCCMRLAALLPCFRQHPTPLPMRTYSPSPPQLS